MEYAVLIADAAPTLVVKTTAAAIAVSVARNS